MLEWKLIFIVLDLKNGYLGKCNDSVAKQACELGVLFYSLFSFGFTFLVTSSYSPCLNRFRERLWRGLKPDELVVKPVSLLPPQMSHRKNAKGNPVGVSEMTAGFSKWQYLMPLG